MYVQDTMVDWKHGYFVHALEFWVMLGEPK